LVVYEMREQVFPTAPSPTKTSLIELSFTQEVGEGIVLGITSEEEAGELPYDAYDVEVDA